MAKKEEDKKGLEDLKDAVEEKAQEEAAPAEEVKEEEAKDSGEEEGKAEDSSTVVEVPQPVLDAQGRAYGTGRRKGAVARVWIKPGSGKITVNGRDQQVYFARATQRLIINQPFDIVERVGQFDVYATVSGGGLSGQAGAVKHGISRALEKFEPALRAPLKKAGFLTRDARVVERKKYGLRKARRGMQWAKR